MTKLHDSVDQVLDTGALAGRNPFSALLLQVALGDTFHREEGLRTEDDS